MKYAVKRDDEESVLITEDGGVATFHNSGEHMITTMYQDRAEMFTMNYRMWSQLEDGKVYVRDWNTKQTLDQEIIDEAMRWLCFPPTSDNVEVDFDSLIQLFNNREI